MNWVPVRICMDHRIIFSLHSFSNMGLVVWNMQKKVWRRDRFMFKITFKIPNQAPTPHCFLERGLPWHDTGICHWRQEQMQSSPSCWPGKGLEKMIFFSLFFKHAWKAQQKSLGLAAHRRGQDVPSGPRSCARATSLSGAGAGQDVPTAPYSPNPGLCLLGLHRPSGARQDPTGLGAKEGELPCWRERLGPCGHPSSAAERRRSNRWQEKFGPCQR